MPQRSTSLLRLQLLQACMECNKLMLHMVANVLFSTYSTPCREVPNALDTTQQSLSAAKVCLSGVLEG